MSGWAGWPRSDTITTLTLESAEARYLTVTAGQVSGWGSAPLPAGAVEAGAVRDPEAVSEALTCLFRQRRLDGRRLVVGVGGAAAVPLGLALPALEGGLLAQAVAEAADRLLPEVPGGVYLSWQVVDTYDDAQRVYVLGVPRGLIDGYLAALDGARLHPAVMDLKALAIVRVARAPQGVVAHLEPDYVDLALVVQSMPVALRTVALAAAGGALPARLDGLLAAVQALVSDYQAEHPQAPLPVEAPLLVSGQALASPEALEHLSRHGGRPVERIMSPLPFPAELPLARYVAHLGLALKREA